MYAPDLSPTSSRVPTSVNLILWCRAFADVVGLRQDGNDQVDTVPAQEQLAVRPRPETSSGGIRWEVDRCLASLPVGRAGPECSRAA